MKWLVLSVVACSAGADARPKTSVVAVALAGPAVDLETACAAWTKQIEVATDHALACAPDDEPVSGTSVVNARGAITSARPLVAEGLDMHCGLAITTQAGVYMPPVTGMFGCGSERSRADWDLRQSSLTISKVDGVTEAIWVVSEKQSLDPANVGATGPTTISLATNIIICHGGDRPACAVIRGSGDVTLARALRDTTIRWPSD